jgi:hypothetical protein
MKRNKNICNIINDEDVGVCLGVSILPKQIIIFVVKSITIIIRILTPVGDTFRNENSTNLQEEAKNKGKKEG